MHVQKTLRVFFKLVGQSKVATLASGEIAEVRHGSAEAPLPSLSTTKLLYVANKHNKCKYLIDTGAAVGVLPKFCTNRTSNATCLPLVAANNTTSNTYGTSRRAVDVGVKRDYAWTFIVANYRSLNAQTVLDRYPIPHIQDFTQLLAESKSFFQDRLGTGILSDTRYRT